MVQSFLQPQPIRSQHSNKYEAPIKTDRGFYVLLYADG